MSEDANADPKAQRREEILAAALAVLRENGYARTSMLAIARRAQASKETLYALFGDKAGLFSALVTANARGLTALLAAGLERDSPEPPAQVLHGFAVTLQQLLLGERALTLNRAAICEAPADPALGRILTAQGRDSVLPRLEAYLAAQTAAGRLQVDDTATAADTLVGLTIGDLQLRRLLGVLAEPGDQGIRARADRVVAQFLALYGNDEPGAG